MIVEELPMAINVLIIYNVTPSNLAASESNRSLRYSNTETMPRLWKNGPVTKA